MTEKSVLNPLAVDVAPMIRFLLARIDEDDSALDRLARQARQEGSGVGAATWGVKRMRAELIAKRHAIGELQQLIVFRDLPAEQAVRQHSMNAVRAMAAVYSHHADFKPSWKRRDTAGTIEPAMPPAES